VAIRAGYRPKAAGRSGRIALAAVTPDEVRAIAAAAGLDLPEDRVEPVRAMLELVLGETAELDVLPLDDLEPMLDV
jgi:Asp-tRNA(Asn)/Glu-tRNA(Gln) amidotransferase C subunit